MEGKKEGVKNEIEGKKESVKGKELKERRKV